MTGSEAAVDEDDYQPIRALNDLLFCERRCAMHRVEQVWVENRFTLEGTSAHKKVHAGPSVEELGAQGRIARGLWVRSERLRLVGIADLVEFRAVNDGGVGVPPALIADYETWDSRPRLSESSPSPAQPGAAEPHCRRDAYTTSQTGRRDAYTTNNTAEGGCATIPYPVEYKRGKRRRWDNDDVQLCAQALCLEEMLGTPVPAGAIFHVKSRRRREIAFDAALRQRTEDAARRLHELFASGETPPPVLKPRCRGCSLRELCLPEMLGGRARAAAYQRGLFAVAVADAGGGSG